ncbi:2-oxo acid dehydrogenase subunit E2 [Eubacteriales bacterium OttesenSCG-928-G02]|nr:2-oxo acid dehydrogenase subunit E2 [Eubacteriales bacterium OttesenSCG-928-G02]
MKKRKEGRRLKSISPMAKVSPYIMVMRSDSQNYITDKIDISAAEDYIFKKRSEGLKGFGMMHLIIAAYVRTIANRPGINRFIRGQKIYTRDYVEVMLTIKKEMNLDAPDSVIKMEFEPEQTADDIYINLNETVEASRKEESNFDNVAKIFNFIPGLFLKFAVWFLTILDYFGLLPRSLTKVSPFHGSFAITSMGSLGIPPIYHHLYNFGNIPVFCAFGAKRVEYELNSNGEIEKKKYIDLAFVTDERICDGFYFASALKYMKSILANPEQLDNPPAEVIRDVD